MDNIITFKAELLSVFCDINLFVIYESKTQFYFYYIFPMFPYKA